MSLAELAPEYFAAIEAELHRAVGAELAHRQQYLARRGPAAPGDANPLPAGALHDYYAMLEYHLGWANDSIANGGPNTGGSSTAAGSSAAAGKRIRPLLCLLCASAAGGDWHQALPLGAALELIHNFSLIHDDIQDNSPLRRGRPTVWRLWGQAQAINAGDAMFTLAYLAPQRLLALGVPAEVAMRALAELNFTCLELTQGQHLDMNFEQRTAVTARDYLAMIEKKTAVLIAASTFLGASLTSADSAHLDHYYAFGWNLGLAYQLQDDLLGIWGDPALTGKSAASDLEQRKKSLPVVYGLEHSADFARRYAQPHQAGQPVAALADELEHVGARDYVQQRVRETTACAEQELARCEAAGPTAPALSELTQQLLHRNQ
jgi:geranylgeranyl diphosphate synthase, type I